MLGCWLFRQCFPFLFTFFQKQLILCIRREDIQNIQNRKKDYKLLKHLHLMTPNGKSEKLNKVINILTKPESKLDARDLTEEDECVQRRIQNFTIYFI